MKDFSLWLYIIFAVAVAVLANSVSAVWARGDDKISWWLLAVIVCSPFVFIIYGLVTTKIGVAISSGTIDALLTLSSVLVGLFLFREWNNISVLQYVGMVFALGGIFLMIFFPKT